jgi:hypothetical protein
MPPHQRSKSIHIRQESKILGKDTQSQLPSFSQMSLELTKKLSSMEKKKNGIFFTPPQLVESILSRIQNLLPCNQSSLPTAQSVFDRPEQLTDNPIHVLEPSCGSGEFITAISNRYGQKAIILGIEFHLDIFQMVKKLETPSITIEHHNFLQFETEKKFDLIIGNPPFFVVKKDTIDSKYFEFFDGRPDIFIIFLLKSLSLLKPGGILSFVLPNNFLNCLYYEKTRRYICENYQIIDIFATEPKDYDGSSFIDTLQKTIVIVLKRENDGLSPCTEYFVQRNAKFFVNNENKIIFGEEKKITELTALLTNSFSLKQLGFCVKVGNVVWNNHKTSLTNDKKNTLLIYSHNIKNGILETPQPERSHPKKNYIKKKGLNQPVILVNRGYGTGKYSFSFCYIDGSIEYLVENHILVIEYMHNESTLEQKRQAYKKVIQSFQLPETKRFVELYFSNNAINATELQNIFPIYGF